jgi:hypothetical protein
MIVVKLQGGLGNQLFQFSFGYALMVKFNQELRMDISNYGKYESREFALKNYNINKDLLKTTSIPLFIRLFETKIIKIILRKLRIDRVHIFDWEYILQIKTSVDHNVNLVKGKKNIYISGYWQSIKYFEDHLKELINMFVLKNELSNECQFYLSQILTSNSVFLHIRRGDYLNKKNQRYLVENRYYEQAILHMTDKVDNPVIYVFSDDIEWVKETYQSMKNFVIIEMNGKYKDLEELFLMSNCTNAILSNSTYSWWGTVLNLNMNNTVISPKRDWDKEFVLNNWILLTNSGDLN